MYFMETESFELTISSIICSIFQKNQVESCWYSSRKKLRPEESWKSSENKDLAQPEANALPLEQGSREKSDEIATSICRLVELLLNDRQVPRFHCREGNLSHVKNSVMFSHDMQVSLDSAERFEKTQ